MANWTKWFQLCVPGGIYHPSAHLPLILVYTVTNNNNNNIRLTKSRQAYVYIVVEVFELRNCTRIVIPRECILNYCKLHWSLCEHFTLFHFPCFERRERGLSQSESSNLLRSVDYFKRINAIVFLRFLDLIKGSRALTGEWFLFPPFFLPSLV